MKALCVTGIAVTVLSCGALADDTAVYDGVNAAMVPFNAVDSFKNNLLSDPKKDLTPSGQDDDILASVVKTVTTGFENWYLNDAKPSVQGTLGSNPLVNGAIKAAASVPKTAMDNAAAAATDAVNSNTDMDAVKSKEVKVYTSIGDSVQSGWGLPGYVAHNKWIVANEQSEGSVPMLVGEKLGAKVNQLHAPGARSNDIRYIVDDNYDGDWITDGQSYCLSDGVLGRENMDSWKPMYREAIAESDVVVVDVGFNDFWIPFYGALLDTADDGRLPWDQMTEAERIQNYGALGTLVENFASLGRAYATHPWNWWKYNWKFGDMLVNFWAGMPPQIFGIMNGIYEINPNATVVVCGGYNPMEEWDLVPAWDDNLVGDALGLIFLTHDVAKMAAVATYPGNAVYVDLRGCEIVTDNTMLFIYEKMSMDDSGFNPHPTAIGSQQMADKIVAAIR